MNEELREAVVFLKPKWQGSDDTSKHIQTLLDLATAYLAVKGWPEAKGDFSKTPEQLDKVTPLYIAEIDGFNDCLHLCKLAYLKGQFRWPEKIDGEYQCEHVKEDVIDGNCVWCNLTVAEKGLDKQRELYQAMVKKCEGLGIIIFKEMTNCPEEVAREYWTGKHYNMAEKSMASKIATAIRTYLLEGK